MTTLQVLIATGYLNVVFLFLVLISCRCMGFWRLTKRLLRYGWFQRVYSRHCWFWYGLAISVIIHAVTALMLFGFGF